MTIFFFLPEKVTVTINPVVEWNRKDFDPAVFKNFNRFFAFKLMIYKFKTFVCFGNSKDGFKQLFELSHVLQAEVGASRAAVDAGWADHDRQIGQTGVTVRPKVYFAFGVSGQIQHIAGMQESGIIVSVNTDPDAPINKIADYVIIGSVDEVVPKMIKYYKKNSK